jgi:hypothetical protein
MIWTGTKEQCDEFKTRINALHPTIKFTHSFDLTNKSVTFLDTTIRIKDEDIETDLYRKPTDRVQYLLPSSSHPNHIFTNVPYSLALRLVRICSSKETLDKRLIKLEKMLISKKYNKNVLKAAIVKAKTVPRVEALKKVTRTKNERPVLDITCNPKLPSVSKIIQKHWTTMSKDPNAKKCFPKPPMVAFKQPDNLKRMLCHAKVPNNSRTTRKLLGMQACNKPCSVCPYIKTTKEVMSLKTKERLPLNGLFTCTATGVIYLISCSKCNQ